MSRDRALARAANKQVEQICSRDRTRFASLVQVMGKDAVPDVRIYAASSIEMAQAKERLREQRHARTNK